MLTLRSAAISTERTVLNVARPYTGGRDVPGAASVPRLVCLLPRAVVDGHCLTAIPRKSFVGRVVPGSVPSASANARTFPSATVPGTPDAERSQTRGWVTPRIGDLGEAYHRGIG